METGSDPILKEIEKGVRPVLLPNAVLTTSGSKFTMGWVGKG